MHANDACSMRPAPSSISAHGVRMPAILYGTAWKKDRTADLVEAAIRLGFRGVDTACQPRHYDERGVGAGVAACLRNGLLRDEPYLQTKFTPVDGQDPASIPYDPRVKPAEQVQQSCAVSLRNLKTDYLDCLVLHSPLRPLPRLMEVWRAMEALCTDGTTRQLGISNCCDLDVLEALARTSRVRPAVVQNRFYARTGYDRDVREFCQRNGIVYQGFWTLTANAHILEHAAVAGIASARGVSAAQVFFRYLTQAGVIPLTGTTSSAHMREDLEIFDFELGEEERATIAALLRA